MGRTWSSLANSFTPRKDVSEPVEDESNEPKSTDTNIHEICGVANIGNTFTSSFQECSNMTVVLNSVENEKKQPSPEPDLTVTFENDLITLQDSLQLLYRSEHAWIVPLPWIHSKTFEPEEFFIHMDIEELDRRGVTVTREDLKLENLFESVIEKGVVPPRRILIQAEAGFGKSTTCTKIVYDWASKTNGYLDHIKLAVIVRLRNITSSLEDEICRFCTSASSESLNDDRVKYLLSKLGHRLLLVLDGLDETSNDVFDTVKRVIAFDHGSKCQSFLRGATILMTSRPNKVTEVTMYLDRHVRIKSMDLEQRDIFVRKYFMIAEQADMVIQLLSTVIYKWNMSPLLLFLICYLEDEGQLGKLEKVSNIVEEFMYCLVKRYSEREGMLWGEEEIQLKLANLGEFCFKLLKLRKTCVDSSEICEEYPDLSHFVMGCGIFQKQNSHTRNSKDVYEIVHKMFMEQLTVSYLQQCCDKILDHTMKIHFIATVIQKPYGVHNRIYVYDDEKEKEICIYSHIFKGSVGVFMRINQIEGKTDANLTITFLSTDEALSHLQKWRMLKSTVSIHAAICLTKRPDSIDLLSIPEQFRKEISLLLNHHGRVVCEYKLFRHCGCLIDTNLLTNDDESLRRVLFFGYFELHNKCDKCSFSNKPELVRMLLRAESSAKSFHVLLNFSDKRDYQNLFVEHDIENRSVHPSLHRSFAFQGMFEDLNPSLEFVLKYIICSSYSTKPVEILTEGDLLLLFLYLFGFAIDKVNGLVSINLKPVCLRIYHYSVSYVFMRDSEGKNTYFYKRGNVSKSQSVNLVKKCLKSWKTNKMTVKDILIKFTFSDSAHNSDCMVSITGKEAFNNQNSVSWTAIDF